MRILPLVVAVAFAVGACSGDGDDGEPAETTTAGAPAERLTGEMATYEREVGQILDELDDSGCPDDGYQQPVCASILDRSSIVAETVIIVVDGASGAPSDVQGLITDTRGAAQAVVDADEQWDGGGCSGNSAGEGCATLAQGLKDAVESLHKQLGMFPG